MWLKIGENKKYWLKTCYVIIIRRDEKQNDSRKHEVEIANGKEHDAGDGVTVARSANIFLIKVVNLKIHK